MPSRRSIAIFDSRVQALYLTLPVWLFMAANPQRGSPFCEASAIDTVAQAQCQVQVHAMGCQPRMGTYVPCILCQVLNAARYHI